MSLIIVDGTALVLRPWFAGAPEPWSTAARQLRFALRGYSHAAVVMDRSVGGFRKDIDPSYKAHRPPADEALIAIFNRFEQQARDLGVQVFGDPRYEADDFAATLCTLAVGLGLPVSIQAADKDLFQLVRDSPPAVRVIDPSRGWDVDEAGVMQRLGVRPDQVVDYQSLVGDASDGVRGVKGVGAKTAAALLGALGGLDAVLSQPEQVRALPIRGAKKLPEKLEAGRAEALLARELVTLKRDIALPAEVIEGCRLD